MRPVAVVMVVLGGQIRSALMNLLICRAKLNLRTPQAVGEEPDEFANPTAYPQGQPLKPRTRSLVHENTWLEGALYGFELRGTGARSRRGGGLAALAGLGAHCGQRTLATPTSGARIVSQACIRPVPAHVGQTAPGASCLR